MTQVNTVRRPSVVFPLLLIVVGVLALLHRWIPTFDPWPTVVRYWPLLLILLGLGMFWDRARRSDNAGAAPLFPLGSTLGAIAFLVILSLLLWKGHAFHKQEWVSASVNRAHRQQTIEKKGAKALHLTVKMPAGELRMTGGSPELLDADFSYGGPWAAPVIDYSLNNGSGEMEIDQESGSKLSIKSDNTWSLKVNDSIPLDLRVDVGAGKGDFRFAKVDLTRLTLNIGAGQAEVDLTGERAKDLEATIEGGVGEAIVHLPKNVGVIAVVHGGLGSVEVHGLKEEDNEYTNAAYGKSPTTIHLTVEGGIGHIKLIQE